MHNDSIYDNMLDNPAILNAADMAKLQSLQNEFCADCGKNVILVAYKG